MASISTGLRYEREILIIKRSSSDDMDAAEVRDGGENKYRLFSTADLRAAMVAAYTAKMSLPSTRIQSMP